MNIIIRQVDAFLMVAELRSFTAAGAALHITQSAVSNLVKDLEDQIGVQLFDRGRRVVKLTAAGKIFFEESIAKRMIKYLLFARSHEIWQREIL